MIRTTGSARSWPAAAPMQHAALPKGPAGADRQADQPGCDDDRSTGPPKIYAQLQDLQYQNALDAWVVQPQGRQYEQQWVQGWFYNPIFGTDLYFYPLSKGS